MKLFFENKLNEYLNDDLLDDDRFVNFVISYLMKGYDVEDIVDTIEYIEETVDY